MSDDLIKRLTHPLLLVYIDGGDNEQRLAYVLAEDAKEAAAEIERLLQVLNRVDQALDAMIDEGLVRVGSTDFVKTALSKKEASDK